MSTSGGPTCNHVNFLIRREQSGHGLGVSRSYRPSGDDQAEDGLTTSSGKSLRIGKGTY